MADADRYEAGPVSAILAQQDAILAGFRIDPRQLVGFIAPWTVHFGMARGVHEQLRRPDLGIADGETLWQFGKVGVDERPMGAFIGQEMREVEDTVRRCCARYPMWRRAILSGHADSPSTRLRLRFEAAMPRAGGAR